MIYLDMVNFPRHSRGMNGMRLNCRKSGVVGDKPGKKIQGPQPTDPFRAQNGSESL